MRLALILVVAAGCGRLGFDDLPLPDAPIDPCAAELVDLGAFGAPAAVAAVNSAADEDDPTPSDDGLELFFTSTRAPSLGAADVFEVTRAAPGAPWSPVQHVVELSSAQNENTPFLTSDNLTMYLVSNRPGTLGMDDLWRATRPSRLAAWTPPVNVTELNSPALDRGPSLYHDGHAILFHSSRGAAGTGFYTATRAALTDPWSPPKPLAAPQGIRGWMSNCGLEIYYEADRNTDTSTDLYVARRRSEDEPFGAERRLDELSSALFDQDIRLSPDRRHAYFASGRDGDSNIYEAAR